MFEFESLFDCFFYFVGGDVWGKKLFNNFVFGFVSFELGDLEKDIKEKFGFLLRDCNYLGVLVC